MKKIKIWYVDFWKPFEPEKFLFTRILSNHYEVELNDKNPDIVFCSLFGSNYLKYHCVRVFLSGEPMTPDFNLYDYAIGFDHLQFGDRYIRYPLYLLDEDKVQLAERKHLCEDKDFLSREKFCNFVVSAGGGEGDIRTEIFHKLSEYQKVDSGGRYMNNLEDGKPVEDKFLFQQKYRFSLAMENSCVSGYTTEKIIDAWAAGTIPIYWGNCDIAKEFNKDAFINVNDYANHEELVNRIKIINEDESEYLRICKTPAFNEGDKLKDREHELEDFLCSIAENQEKRRTSAMSMWGRIYEYKANQYEKMMNNSFVNVLRKWKRSLFGLKKI